MGKHRTITITLRWRTAAALVPAAVLAASGVALTQTGATSDGGPLPSVPETPITQAAPMPSPTLDTDIPPVAPALVLPQGVVPGSTQPVRLDSGPGIPAPALAAYQRAAALLDRADPGCHLDWALLGAIGRVESDHARFGGNALDAQGIARPGIIGIPLDGRAGTALIRDTDGGRWDHDTVYDRAVGPMQFIPGTWRSVAADGDGDGQRNPQSLADAATSAGVYLCSGPGDLRQPGNLYQAIRRYNNSDSYARTVMAIADAYRRGVTSLPANELPAARPAGPASAEPLPSKGGSGEGTDAARPGTSTGGAPGAGAATPGAGGDGAAGGTSSPSSAPTGSPARPPAGGPVGSGVASVGAGVSSVASLVTSVVTIPVPLDQPIVRCVTELVTNPLGLLTPTQVCTTTSTTSTTTTTVAPAP
ncbi:MAG TPA: lytic murein transglycosylase [Actinomycetales bacterium]|nr:lytic murein transglycosylase [Actinomycetales bacterium]